MNTAAPRVYRPARAPSVGPLPLSPAVLALVTVAVAALFLGNLGDCLLWQDEGLGAAVSRTILSGGLPRGFDGRNFFSQELGVEYGAGYLWRWHTWLPFYLVAACLRLFGSSTLVTRLPFALAGMATVPVVYRFAARLFRDRDTGLAAAALLVLNVPFLLLSRQCRYYAMAALFSLICLNCYLALENQPSRRRTLVWLVGAATLLFHVHYLYVATVYLTLLIHAASRRRHLLPWVVGAGAATALVNSPFIIWFGGVNYWSNYGGNLRTVLTPLTNGGRFLVALTVRTWPPLFLIALALAVYLGLRQGAFQRWSPNPVEDQSVRERRRSAWALCGIFAVVNVALLSILSPAAFSRFLTPLIPVGCAALAPLVVQVTRRRTWMGAALLGALVLGGPMPSYLYEITHHYRGPMDGILEYLAANARPGQLVAITYGDLPIKYYRSDLRVLGGLTGEDLTPAARADFIFLRKHVICTKDQAVRDWLLRNVDWSRYQKIEIDAPDARFQNRESLPEHQFRTVTGEDKVTVYRRVR
jgi:4-amino-4-deoxy-L-arabinose transferase-like glycosyltransferase